MGNWTLSVSKGSRYIFVLLSRYHHQEFNSIVLDPGVGDKRRLCIRCYGAAVEREEKKVRPWPAVIDPGSMTRDAASVGRCSICDLAPAAWNGEAGGSAMRAIKGKYAAGSRSPRRDSLSYGRCRAVLRPGGIRGR
jgi:hypothetical protein